MVERELFNNKAKIDLPKVRKHHEEMFIFFENFIVDNWNSNSVAGLSGLIILISLLI